MNKLKTANSQLHTTNWINRQPVSMLQMVPSLNGKAKIADHAKRKYTGTDREYLPDH